MSKHIIVTGTRGIPNVMGGVETHCEELYPRVVKRGFQVDVIRRDNYVNDGLKEWKGVGLIDISSPKRKAFEAIIHTFRAILEAKKRHADIIHIHAIGPALLVPFARLLGMKVVFTSHGPDYNRAKWGKGAKMMLKIGERLGASFANEVIVISQEIDRLFRNKYHRNNCHIIPNGVSQPIFHTDDAYFNDLGIEKRKYILAMCRFVPEKNLHHLIEAFTKLRAQGLTHNTQLVIAGDSDFEDDYSTKLKEMARRNDIVMTGFVKGEKLQSLLSHARCYVLPSSHEGLPIGLLEAMSYGLPVIVSDIEPHQEIGLDRDCYFHLGDIDELSTALRRNIELTFHQVDYDMKKYNWEHIADEVCSVYKGILNNDKGN